MRGFCLGLLALASLTNFNSRELARLCPSRVVLFHRALNHAKTFEVAGNEDTALRVLGSIPAMDSDALKVWDILEQNHFPLESV